MNLKHILRESIYKVLAEGEYSDKLQSKIEDSESEYSDADKTCGTTHQAIDRINKQQQRLRNWRNGLSTWKQIGSQKRYRKLQDRLHNELKNELVKNSRAAIRRDQAELKRSHLKGFKDNGTRIGNLDDL